MQLQDEYDWVVLGDHPGALLSAGIASQLGLSVLVLPLVPSALSVLSQSGQCLDPEPNCLLGLRQWNQTPGLLGECLSRFGIDQSLQGLLLGGERSGLQILTPTTRFQLKSETGGLMQELSREFSGEFIRASNFFEILHASENAAATFWKSFPNRLLTKGIKKSRPSLLRWLPDRQPAFRLNDELQFVLEHSRQRKKGSGRAWFDPLLPIDALKSRSGRNALSQRRKKNQFFEPIWESFEESLFGLWYGMTGIDLNPPTTLELFHLLSLAGTASPFRGGISAYRRYLASSIAKQGPQFPNGVRCRRIFIEDGNLMGVQLAERGRVIAAKGGVLGCALGQAREYFSFSGSESIRRLKKDIQPAGWRFTIALTVHAEAVPVGMSSRAIWKERGAPALELEVADPRDYDLVRGDSKLLFLRTWLPFTQDTLDTAYQRMVASRMFKQAVELFPFLEFHVIHVFPDFRGPESSSRDEFSEVYGFVSPQFIPENLRMLTPQGLGASTGIRNLYAASGESYPWLGNFGGTVAALEALSDFVEHFNPSAKEKLATFWGKICPGGSS